VGQVGSGGANGGAGTPLVVQGLPPGGSIHLDDIGALGTNALIAWLVPGLFLTLPGLLILLIILLQVSFATAFIPVTRRVLGGKRDTRSNASPREA
jgi:hypothetical protein